MSLLAEIAERADGIRTHPTALALQIETEHEPDATEILRLYCWAMLEQLGMILALAQAIDELAGD